MCPLTQIIVQHLAEACEASGLRCHLMVDLEQNQLPIVIKQSGRNMGYINVTGTRVYCYIDHFYRLKLNLDQSSDLGDHLSLCVDCSDPEFVAKVINFWQNMQNL